MAVIKFMLGNLRMRKSYSIVICILIFITGAIAAVTISTVKTANTAYDNAFNRTASPHILYWFVDDKYKPEYKQWLEEQKGVEAVTLRKVMSQNGAFLQFGSRNIRSSSDDCLLEYSPKDNMRLIDSVHPAQQLLSKGEIYLPYIFKTEDHFKTGEVIDFVFGSNTMHFKIAGFLEEPLYGGEMLGVKLLFLSKADMDQFAVISGDKGYTNVITGVRLHSNNSAELSRLNKAFTSRFNPNVHYVIDYAALKNYHLMLPQIAMAIMVTFLAILVIITITIMRYAILATIEADYQNIGIAKALGFTPAMVQMTITGQYALLALLSAGLGIAASLFLSPVLGGVVLLSSGLYCNSSLSPMVGLSILLALVLIITLFSYLTSRRTRRISPMRAISMGTAPAYFKSRLNVSLEHLRFLPFNLRMALKQVLTKFRRYILLISISGVLAFSLILLFGLVDTLNSDKVFKAVGTQLMDIELDASNKADLVKLVDQIRRDYPVETIALRIHVQMMVEGEKTFVQVMDTYDTKDFQTIKGRIPKHDNEVALSYLLGKKFGKGVGEEVVVRDAAGRDHRFLITGIFQTINEGGNVVWMLESGMKTVEQKWELNEGYVKLKSHDRLDQVIAEMKVRYTDYEEISNERKDTMSMVGTIQSIFEGISNMVLGLTLIVISFITLLIMRITVFTEIREMGILKSVGFNSGRIRFQLAIRFLLVTLAGALAGTVLEYFFGGKMFDMVLHFVGIAQLGIAFNPVKVLFAVGVMSLLAMGSAYVSSGRVKRVSPYALMNE